MRIAVVGAGISGLTASYLLRQKHDVHVFEKEDWLGGHTHTLDVMEGNNKLKIDTGFIVFNDKTYPSFNKLLKKLGVERQETTMSFSVSNSFNGLEYNGTDLPGLFAQRSNLINFNFIRMLASILKLNNIAKAIAKKGCKLSLAQFIKEYNIKPYTVENYLLPMCCAIWSGKRKQILETPVQFIFNFLNNHGMLNINDRPQWYVVKGGSSKYVQILADNKEINFHHHEPVLRVSRSNLKVKIETLTDNYYFDKVVMATHANDTLTLLQNPTQEEINILSCFQYQDNNVSLHKDISVLPKNKRAWAAWNYRIDELSDDSCRLSYNMNMLQDIKAKETYCVSVNQLDLIDNDKKIAEFTYAHPIQTKVGFDAQKEQLNISGKGNIYYCGAYWGYGFHEDGVSSALHISQHLDGEKL